MAKLRPRPKRPAEALIIRARAGDVDAMYELGRALRSCGTYDDPPTRESKADLAEADKWRRRAAEGGHVEAMVDLAWDLGGPHATDAQRAERLRWNRQAAERGHARAMYLTGLAHYRTSEGRRWLRTSFEAGCSQALIDLGCWPPPDEPAETALELSWLQRVAERGEALAMRLVARRLAATGASPQEIRGWLERAAEAGDTESRSELAELRAAEGDDPAAALRLAVEALGTYHCKQRKHPDVQAVIARYGGMARAQLLLARRLELGDGLAADPNEAMRWYLAARHAPTEEPEAVLEATLAAIRLVQRLPGRAYEDDDHGTTDARRLVHDVRRTAETLAMSRFHFWGPHWHPTVAEALLPALLALPAQAAAGDPQAQFELAWFLRQGLGCPRHPARALRWEACAAAGHLVAAYDVAAHARGHGERDDWLAAFEPFLVLAAVGPSGWGIPPQDGDDPLRPFWRDARDRWLATRPAPGPRMPVQQRGCVIHDPEREALGREITAIKEAWRKAIGPANNLFVVSSEPDDTDEGTLAIYVDGEPANRLARRLAAEAAPTEPPPPPVPPMLTYRGPKADRTDSWPALEIWFEGRRLARFGAIGRLDPRAAERGLAVERLIERAGSWCGRPRAFLEGRGVRSVEAIAAASGDPEACLRVGKAFLVGERVARDVQAACIWFELAAAAGSEEARRWRDEAKEHGHRPILAEGVGLRDGIAFAWWLGSVRGGKGS